MNRTLRNRLDRLVHRLGPQGTLTTAEGHELATLEAEYGSEPPFESMSHAQLEGWIRTWGCGSKGARLGELRQRARTPEQCRADEEQAARIATMSEDELDDYLSGATQEGGAYLTDEERQQNEVIVAANKAYLAGLRAKRVHHR